MLFATADTKFHYLVVSVSGPSRAPVAAMNYCGAGTEVYLFWLALDHQWRVQKQQAALIASCFESADGSYEIAGKHLNASWDN